MHLLHPPSRSIVYCVLKRGVRRADMVADAPGDDDPSNADEAAQVGKAAGVVGVGVREQDRVEMEDVLASQG